MSKIRPTKVALKVLSDELTIIDLLDIPLHQALPGIVWLMTDQSGVDHSFLLRDTPEIEKESSTAAPLEERVGDGAFWPEYLSTVQLADYLGITLAHMNFKLAALQLQGWSIEKEDWEVTTKGLDYSVMARPYENEEKATRHLLWNVLEVDKLLQEDDSERGVELPRKTVFNSVAALAKRCEKTEDWLNEGLVIWGLQVPAADGGWMATERGKKFSKVVGSEGGVPGLHWDRQAILGRVIQDEESDERAAADRENEDY